MVLVCLCVCLYVYVCLCVCLCVYVRKCRWVPESARACGARGAYGACEACDAYGACEACDACNNCMRACLYESGPYCEFIVCMYCVLLSDQYTNIDCNL